MFVWWRGATAGTWFTTWLTGKFVGADKYGNRYYENRTGKRRWIIYQGTVEASFVPPDWHGWLHHTFKEPPTVEAPRLKAWEKDHQPNLTGTPGAYHPPGSLVTGGGYPQSTDYEPWKPA